MYKKKEKNGRKDFYDLILNQYQSIDLKGF